MLTGQCRAIVVGNAQPDLREWAETEIQAAKARVSPMVASSSDSSG